MAIKRVSYKYSKSIQVSQKDLGLRSTCRSMFEVRVLNIVDYHTDSIHNQFWIGSNYFMMKVRRSNRKSTNIAKGFLQFSKNCLYPHCSLNCFVFHLVVSRCHFSVTTLGVMLQTFKS